MDDTIQTPDTPVVDEPTQQPAVQPADQDTPEQPQVEAQPTDQPAAAPAEEVQEEEEEEFYPQQQLPQSQPLDFSQLPVGEDNLLDPNALAGAINQQVATAEERAFLRAQQAFQEQQAETKSWEKAYEKYPELKSNKELRDMVHNSRLGAVADMLSRNQDPASVKLPTPAQVADKFFKQVNSARAQGMKQATENTVIQASAHVETAGTRTSDSSDAKAKSFQNINNPNKEVATKARNDLLKSFLGWDD